MQGGQSTAEYQSAVVLADISSHDEKWNIKKGTNVLIGDLYRVAGEEWHTYADRLHFCSEFLEFQVLQSSEQQALKLVAARFCRVRFCPICMWRRSMRWQARVYAILPKILETYPKHRWLFLTVSRKNVPIQELRPEVEHLGRAFTRMTQRVSWPAIGWIKALECTRSENGWAHPHFHVLLMVKPDYFSGRNYMKQQRWVELWRSCARVDYDPRVDIRTVRGEPSAAIPELIKYECKPSDIIKASRAGDDWLTNLQSQLHHVRAIAVGGVLRPFLAEIEEEPEDLIGLDGANPDCSQLRAWFHWIRAESTYQLYDAAITEGQAVG